MKTTHWLSALPCGLLLLLAVQAEAIEVRSPSEQERGNFGYRVLAISDITGVGIPELAVSSIHHHIDPRGPWQAVSHPGNSWGLPET